MLLLISIPDRRKHEISVLGAAERFGFHESVFHDCRKDLDATIYVKRI